MSTTVAPPPVKLPITTETSTDGTVTLIIEAELPHPARPGQCVKQTFRRVVGNPDADPGRYYNDPFGFAVLLVLRENERLKSELAALQAQSRAVRK